MRIGVLGALHLYTVFHFIYLFIHKFKYKYMYSHKT